MKRIIGAFRYEDGRIVRTVLPVVVLNGTRIFHASQFGILPTDLKETAEAKIRALLGSDYRETDQILYDSIPSVIPLMDPHTTSA
jgi:hypothetical protein